MRTSSIPSAAIRSQAASRIRSRASRSAIRRPYATERRGSIVRGGAPGGRRRGRSSPRFALEADVGDADQLDPGEQQVVGAFAVGLEGASATRGSRKRRVRPRTPPPPSRRRAHSPRPVRSSAVAAARRRGRGRGSASRDPSGALRSPACRCGARRRACRAPDVRSLARAAPRTVGGRAVSLSSARFSSRPRCRADSSGARSSTVRAGEVTGIPSTVVTSSGSSRAKWTTKSRFRR